jgi:hypothetical protein
MLVLCGWELRSGNFLVVCGVQRVFLSVTKIIKKTHQKAVQVEIWIALWFDDLKKRVIFDLRLRFCVLQLPFSLRDVRVSRVQLVYFNRFRGLRAPAGNYPLF